MDAFDFRSVTSFLELEKMKSEFQSKSFVTMFLVDKVNSIPCDFMEAILAIFAIFPPTPCELTIPIKSKLLREYQSALKLIRLSRNPISTPMFSSCFFS